MGNIFIENYEGLNNAPERYRAWGDLGLYKNLNTVMVIPTRGTCGTRVAVSWRNIQNPPNSCICPMVVEGYEVGKAYNNAILNIFANPFLAKFPYLLTVEEDNTPSPDSLIKLFKGIQSYDAVGGLYWIKGEGGSPMIWGDPKVPIDEPNAFVPQPPIENTLQECNGLGMGFTLFRLDMFKNPGFEQGQWFKTVGEKNAIMTQDLYFFRNAKKLGYKFAVDTSCKIGHYDQTTGAIW
jgi:hypothetical protein